MRFEIKDGNTKLMKAILGKKIGMSQVFTEDGTVVPVSLVEAGPCVVTQIKAEETDGYSSIQLGFGDCEKKSLTKPELGHLKKSKVLKKHLVEVRLKKDEELNVGDTVSVDIFGAGDKVNVSGISKGKGFAGVIKRHGFKGGPASHGAHFHRAPGSIGASATPSRVFKGTKLPGQLGNKRVSSINLEIFKVEKEKNLMLIKGSVPGSRGGLLFIKSRNE